MSLPADSVVLESIAFFWPSWPCQVSTVCHGYFQGAPARLRCPWRHEWHSEVSDPSRWQVHRSPSFGSHMVRGRVCSPSIQIELAYMLLLRPLYPRSGTQIWPWLPWSWGNSEFGGFVEKLIHEMRSQPRLTMGLGRHCRWTLPHETMVYSRAQRGWSKQLQSCREHKAEEQQSLFHQESDHQWAWFLLGACTSTQSHGV